MAQCGALSGDAKDQCRKNAKAAHDKAMADAEASHGQGQGRRQGAQVEPSPLAAGAACKEKGARGAPPACGVDAQRTTAICSRLSPL